MCDTRHNDQLRQLEASEKELIQLANETNRYHASKYSDEDYREVRDLPAAVEVLRGLGTGIYGIQGTINEARRNLDRAQPDATALQRGTNYVGNVASHVTRAREALNFQKTHGYPQGSQRDLENRQQEKERQERENYGDY